MFAKKWTKSGREFKTKCARAVDELFLVKHVLRLKAKQYRKPFLVDHSVTEISTSGETSVRVKWFERANRWLERWVAIITAAHEGFWLGCLTADDLNAITANHFAESQFYPSTEHNLSGLFAWEKLAVEQHFIPGSRLLVAGAGAGREVLGLRKAGFHADGFECSAPLVAASHKIFDQLGQERGVVYSPADCVPPGPAIYDGLIIGWTVYTHIPTLQRRIAFLRALGQRALPQSPVLVSFFARNTNVRTDTVVHNVARLFRFVPGLQRQSPELGDRLSHRRFVHYFTSDAIHGELRSGGFEVVRYSQDGDAGHAVGILR